MANSKTPKSIAVALGLLSQQTLLAQPNLQTAALLDSVQHSIAQITATNSQDHSTQSLGFVVESEGFLLTSYSTLRNARGGLVESVKVKLLGSEHSYRADIVSIEPTLDIAILKIQTKQPLAIAKIAARESITPGMTIHALDVSTAEATEIPGVLTDLNSMDCYQESLTATMLKADIDLPQTSLGGPIYNSKGEIIGLHTGHNDNLANSEHNQTESNKDKEQTGQHLLPIFLAFNIYDSIKNKKSFRSPWTGFSVRPLTENEKSIFPIQRFFAGLGIDHIWPGSPAEKLGIKEGDILVRFSYYPTPSEAEFQKWLYAYGVGESIKLHFIRDSKDYYTVDYTIEERPAAAIPK